MKEKRYKVVKAYDIPFGLKGKKKTSKFESILVLVDGRAVRLKYNSNSDVIAPDEESALSNSKHWRKEDFRESPELLRAWKNGFPLFE